MPSHHCLAATQRVQAGHPHGAPRASPLVRPVDVGDGQQQPQGDRQRPVSSGGKRRQVFVGWAHGGSLCPTAAFAALKHEAATGRSLRVGIKRRLKPAGMLRTWKGSR